MPLLGGGYTLGAGYILAGGSTGIAPPPGGGIEVAMDGKHPVLIGVAMQYVNAQGNTVWGTPEVFTYDVPLVALIQSISVRYLGTGEVIPSVVGDEDVVTIYGNVGINTPPADPTAVSKDFTVASGNGSPASTGRFAQYGDFVYVNARGVDKNGVLGPSKLVAFHRGDASKHAPKVHATAIRSGETVTVTIEVDDATKSVTSIMHKRREGNGAIDTSWLDVWDLGSTGTVGIDTYLKRIRAVSVSDGLDSELHWRVEYTNENGVTEEIGDSINLANLREISKTLIIPFAEFDGANREYGSITDGLVTDDSNVHPNAAATTATLFASVVVPVGCEMTLVRIYGRRENVGDTVSFSFFRGHTGGGPIATLASGSVASGGYGSASGSLSRTVATGEFFVIQVDLAGAASKTDALLNYAEVTYDAPTYEFTR